MCIELVHKCLEVCILFVQINAQCVHSVHYLLTHILLCAILNTTGEAARSCYELCEYQRRYYYE